MKTWIRAALLVGLVYFLVGRLFAAPASHVHFWRLAAWVVSGLAYAAHIGYEHFSLRNSPRSIALHAALAVAVGAFALAVAGFVHSLWAGAAITPLRVLAFAVWPVGSAVPAFVVAFVIALLLARFQPKSSARG